MTMNLIMYDTPKAEEMQQWHLKRRGVVQAFRNNQKLRQFVLTDVTPTGKVLGTGSYGSVEEVKYQHLVCAGKKIHEALIEDDNEGVAELVHKYEQECQLMSSLRHPNITLFLGLCFLPGTQLPLLVMERLETSLDDLLEHMPGLPLSLKRSILEDVASGLVYLHKRTPPVIHRDLTAKNILLTSSLVAKITDMGNSRIVNMRPGQMAKTLSKAPGTLVYMPPEALGEIHHYGPSLDIFSFGHLALYTIIQKFPGELLHNTFLNHDNTGEIHARTELERRGGYIEILECEIGLNHPAVVQLVKQCLHDDPAGRPITDEVLGELQRMKVEVEGKYGGSFIKLDIARVKLAKDMDMKDRRIEELSVQEERQQAELEEMERELQLLQARDEHNQEIIASKNREITSKDSQIQLLQNEVEASNRQLQQQESEVECRNRQLQQLQSEVEDRDRTLQQLLSETKSKDEQLQLKEELIIITEAQMEELRIDLESRESQMMKELQIKEAEISSLTDKLKRLQQEGAEKVPLLLESTFQQLEGAGKVPIVPLKLNWRDGPDMPFEMSVNIQSVVVEEKMYVGGGYTKLGDKKVVMEYDTHSEQWATLPPYKTCHFAMTVIHNQLVLVGGLKDSYQRSKQLGVWRAASNEWVHPYPNMPTARYSGSAVSYETWLVVAGGFDEGRNDLTSVQVLNFDSKQWYTAPPMSTGWNSMKTARVGDIWYLMGGAIGRFYTNKVYSVSLPVLISQLKSKSSSNRGAQIWNEVSELDVTQSAPLSISGSLLSLGGWKDDKNTTTIQLYQPESGKWLKVGDLPSPRRLCTNEMISEREILVAGGSNKTRRTDIASLI